MDSGRLYIVPTPIGNLEDITLRALTVLKQVDLILAEDTRTSGKLLNHYNIETRKQSYHQHNEHKVLQSLIDRLIEGETMAVITDAGTPGISDPGFLLVRECIRNGIEVETLPGLPCDKFYFEGFLPQKKGRQTRLKELAVLNTTLVFYESPHRLIKTLTQLAEYFGPERPAAVSRELSKLHEENARGTLAELIKHFESKTIKGEIVIVVGQ